MRPPGSPAPPRFPIRLAQQTVCAGQGRQPAVKARNEFFAAGMRAHRLVCDRLNDRKRVLDRVRQVAVHLLTAAIPFDDTAVEFPYENGRSRKLHQTFLLTQLAFADW
jgi:hypothetical protein